MLVYLVGYLVLWTAMILMTLVIFRFRIEKYKIQIVLTGLTLAPISTLIQFQAYSFLGILQISCYVILLWLFLKVNIGYALLMACTGYILSVIPDVLTDWFYEAVLDIQVVNADVQRVAILLFNLLVIFIFRKFRLGFSFVPEHKSNALELRSDNKGILILIGITIFVIIIGTIFVTSEAGQIYVLAVLVALCLILSVMFRLYYVKDMED
ncbi:hypothetical protein [Paenibacillus gansuensis]|uniref:Uncharacterized protein n=1 Tax=Paenibacillus gansuensis TaxID=306542 RepID=A0ABW5PH45_9BACL